MKKETRERFHGQVIRIGTEVKTIVLLQHILKKYFLSDDKSEVFLKRSPRFSFAISQFLMSELFMRLSKLDDPPETGKNRNISFPALKKIWICSGAKIKSELRESIRNYSESIRKVKEWRNKSGAHLDERFNLIDSGGEEIYPIEIDTAIDLAILIADNFHELAGLEFNPQGHLYYDDAEALLENLRETNGE